MKKIFLLLTILSFSNLLTAQVKVNQNAANSAINTSSAFMDASSSPLWNGTTNQGKGMLYPRVDLVAFASMSHAGPFNASNNPNYFDGLLVFNTATGVAGIGADSVYPGYYYYRNTTTTANGGHWVSLKGINGATGAVGPIGLTGVAGTNGLNALVNTTTEAAGANCVNGGTKVEYGLDDNNNGILDLVEVEAALTKYVCNGNSVGALAASSFDWTIPDGLSNPSQAISYTIAPFSPCFNASGAAPVGWYNNSYTVPTGYNLYITQYITVNNYAASTTLGIRYNGIQMPGANSCSFTSTNPFIAGEGSVLSFLQTYVDCLGCVGANFKGFLLPKTVDVIYRATTYTVPVGFKFIVYNVTLNFPTIYTSGQIVPVKTNGYIIPN